MDTQFRLEILDCKTLSEIAEVLNKFPYIDNITIINEQIINIGCEVLDDNEWDWAKSKDGTEMLIMNEDGNFEVVSC